MVRLPGFDSLAFRGTLSFDPLHGKDVFGTVSDATWLLVWKIKDNLSAGWFKAVRAAVSLENKKTTLTFLPNYAEGQVLKHAWQWSQGWFFVRIA